MTILRMRASFGKLNEELQLHEGLNILCMPNEAGKSTWSAFLLAMLYGIDTKEKASSLNEYLPAKERYKPWDGRAMEGTIELLFNGRRITIERRSTGRVPMGDFRAFDSLSGDPLPELTAENCGRMLCGVERSVFERTAFIRQLGLSVEADHALEKRLNTLVTTGEEGMSASQILDQLHDMKVKLARSKTGRIDQLSQQIDNLLSVQNKAYALQEEALSLRARIDAGEEELARFNALLVRIEQAESAKKRQAMTQMEQRLKQQEVICARLQEQSERLPSVQELHGLRSRLDEANNHLNTARLEQAFAPEAPQKPQPPSCFVGLDEQQAAKQLKSDEAKFAALSAVKEPKKRSMLLSLLPILLGIAAMLYKPLIGVILLCIGAICLGVSAVAYARQNRKYQDAQRHRERILSRYSVDSIEQAERFVMDYAEQMRFYRQAVLAYEAETKKRSERLSDAQTELSALHSSIRAFAPECADAREAIASALQIHSELLSENRSLELQRSQLASMQQLLGDVSAEPLDVEALSMDAPKLRYEKNAAEQKLARLQETLAACLGKLSITADVTVLQSQLEECRTQLDAAKERYAQVCLAEAAVQRADEALRSRFSPQITAEAGRILAAMTEGKYPHLLLKSDMSLSVREKDGVVTHPSAAMSCGTADQMYFALRIAMVRRLLPEFVPILLDDAFVNFDDRRTAAAVDLLNMEAKQRQVILFTCKEISHVL